MIAKTEKLSPALYLVATPIGNARDITLRALDVLNSADVLVSEDTRTLRKLMGLHGLSVGDRPLLAYHDHSNDAARSKVIGHILQGKSVAYASEAGMPLIADPGYRLVQDVIENGCEIVCVPGATAALSALSISGFATDNFTFAGFLPNSSAARKKALAQFATAPGTLIFYESPKRVEKFLADAIEVLGGECRAAICRELTKKFEDAVRGTLTELLTNPGTLKGEVVIVIGPREEKAQFDEADLDRALEEALMTMKTKEAAAFVAQAFGLKKRDLYQRALSLSK